MTVAESLGGPAPDTAADRGWGQLGNLRARIETSFLKAGDNVEKLVLGLASLQEPLKTLTGVRSEKWTALSKGLDALSVLEKELGAALLEYHRIVGAMILASDGLDGEIADLRRIIRTMKIVALNARVTASAVSHREGGLEVFTNIAGDLVAEADETLAEVVDLLDKVQRNIGASVHDCLERAWRELDQVAAMLGLVSQTLGPLAAAGAAGDDFGPALQDRLMDLSRTMAGALVALQVGDRTRQRLEHVEVIAAQGHGKSSGFILSLAREQLSDTAEEFRTGVSMVRERLEDALRLAHTFGGVERTEPGGHVEASETANDAERILWQVRSIQHGIAALQETRTELQALVTEIVDYFAALDVALAHINSLEHQMQLVGINAVIACGRLGQEGMALKEVANQLSGFASDVSRLLATVRRRLASVEVLADELTGDLAAKPGLLIADMSEKSTSIMLELEDIFRKSDLVTTEMVALFERLQRRVPEDTARRGALKGTLADLVDSIPVPALIEATPPMDLINGPIFHAYSVERERALHDDFCGRHGLQKQVHVEEDAARQTMDDIFF
ncbi:hypothetical protein [uncultured Maritimibacter sp.]|jgi:hypothetical protein|uniref:hypothetical protein n=1 Tax=uncultured Maritimibacter sp. TaxID=991866 RepID=UPI00260648A8|nr:hypothetical protein [uncultured Maritimibacter sp.]